MILRNVNATINGQRLLSSPYSGVLASTIASETAVGENGPGLLYNESVDATYANKYLRVWITAYPATANLIVADNGSFTMTNIPNGIHSMTYDVYADDAYDSAATATITAGIITLAGATSYQFNLCDAKAAIINKQLAGVISVQNNSSATGSLAAPILNLIGIQSNTYNICDAGLLIQSYKLLQMSIDQQTNNSFTASLPVTLELLGALCNQNNASVNISLGFHNFLTANIANQVNTSSAGTLNSLDIPLMYKATVALLLLNELNDLDIPLESLLEQASEIIDLSQFTAEIFVNRDLRLDLNNLPVNVKQVNDINVIGAGKDGIDEWRAAT